MSRNYLTERQNEEQKRKLRMTLYDNRTISTVHPEVKQIEIICEVEHRSAFRVSRENHTALYKPDHTNNFIINCLNRECTVGFFDLKNEISDMIRQKQTELSGLKDCEGSEAPDYMNQSCGGLVRFSILITYLEP